MGKKVLLYEFKGIRLGQVHKALEKLPFEIRVVERQEYWMTLGYLADWKEALPWGSVMTVRGWNRRWWYSPVSWGMTLTRR